MKLYLDPEILFLRTSAKVGGEPFQLAFTVADRKDELVLDGTQLGHQVLARRPGHGYRLLAISEYSDLDPVGVFVKLRSKVRHIDLSIRENERFRKVHEFGTWADLCVWLGDAEETAEARYTVVLPLSLYKASQNLAEKRRAAGGRGTLKELHVAALAEYIERHS